MSFFAAVPTGTVLDFGGDAAPRGFLLCFGQTVSRVTYKRLFDTIGTKWGVGDGSTTFVLPDGRGRVVAGADNMGGTAANRLTLAISGINAAVLGTAGAGGDERLQSHNHAATGLTAAASAVTGTVGGSDGTHAHTISDPGHSHTTNFGAVLYGRTDGDTNILDNVGNSYTRAGGASPSATGITGTTTTGSGHGHAFSLTAAAQAISGNTALQGGGSSQNVQPTLILNKMIKI